MKPRWILDSQLLEPTSYNWSTQHPKYPSSLTLISTSSNYPSLGLQSSLFRSGFPTKITCAHIAFPMRKHTVCTRLYNGMNLQLIWVDDPQNIWRRRRSTFIWMKVRNQWRALVETEWTFTFLTNKSSSSPCRLQSSNQLSIHSSSSCSWRVRSVILFLNPQDEVGPSTSSLVVPCSFVLLVYIIILVSVVYLCQSSVCVVATFSGTVLFHLLYSVLLFFP